MLDQAGIVLDEDRENRLGFDEAIFCAQKTVEQIERIVQYSREEGRRRLFTRLDGDTFQNLSPDARKELRYDDLSRTAVLGECAAPAQPRRTAVVSAGSSDAPVVAEACATLRYYGQDCLQVADVGVAGIWRLLARIDDIKHMPVVIAVAGMDGALPSVLAGLVPGSIIGVPTSTGYGAARGGETAFSAMLSSCAPGLTVVNIDNGYGAACAALRVLRAVSG